MAASRQAYELNQQRVRLEAKVREMEKESSRQAKVKAKLEDKVKDFKNLIKQLKEDAVKNDTLLDHFQKRSDELCTLLGETKEAAIKEFKASNKFTDLLDGNYTAGFKDFHMDTIQHFPRVDFSPIKLCVFAESSFL